MVRLRLPERVCTPSSTSSASVAAVLHAAPALGWLCTSRITRVKSESASFLHNQLKSPSTAMTPTAKTASVLLPSGHKQQQGR